MKKRFWPDWFFVPGSSMHFLHSRRLFHMRKVPVPLLCFPCNPRRGGRHCAALPGSPCPDGRCRNSWAIAAPALMHDRAECRPYCLSRTRRYGV